VYYPPAKSTANSPIQNTSWIGASSLPHKKRSISSNSVMAPCSLCLPHDDPTNATNVCFGGKSYMAGYSRRSCGCFIPGRPPSPHYSTVPGTVMQKKVRKATPFGYGALPLHSFRQPWRGPANNPTGAFHPQHKTHSLHPNTCNHHQQQKKRL
jgi:hypothetical protein